LRHAIRQRIALDTTGRAAAPHVEPLAPEAVASDTGELAWRLPAKDQGILEIRSPRTKGFLGHADGKTLDLGEGVQVTVARTRTGWCTLMLTLLDGDSLGQQPRRALLVATGYTENTDMGWRDETKSTVGTNWGRPPSLVEPVSAMLQLPGAKALPTLYPLDERGQRGAGVPFAATADGAARVALGPPHRTLWYEIVWPPQ
jgi:hypothetical protein